ncbi:hypothetical protein ACFVKB_35640 [Rhodococcus sp. NPDC127530]|uniref:hypothetical protein n=1 Tax=unclassified Rhodococcus (in: high G+C Gram-positive bacteria) TaxID=192944 RepID=UPI0036399277
MDVDTELVRLHALVDGAAMHVLLGDTGTPEPAQPEAALESGSRAETANPARNSKQHRDFRDTLGRLILRHHRIDAGTPGQFPRLPRGCGRSRRWWSGGRVLLSVPVDPVCLAVGGRRALPDCRGGGQ